MVKKSEEAIKNPFLLPYEFYRDNIDRIMETIKENGHAFQDYLKYSEVFEKTQIEKLAPVWNTENKVMLDLNTLELRDFSKKGEGIYTLIVPPYAGHTSKIVDFNPKQSLIETLLENGIEKVCSIDWKSATEGFKDYNIDNYLSELDLCVDKLGDRVNLVGMCQGGWLVAMYAARFPERVNTLIMGGSPINTDVGETLIKEYAHKYPMEFFEGLVAAGGGVMRGEFMLDGYKSLHPHEQYLSKYIMLYENIDNQSYVQRFETFERWYEYTIDLPGKWYLQVVKELFKENRFFKGEFVGLGKKLSLGNIKCPVYMLAGDRDDLTPKEQMFHAEEHLGTEKSEVVKDIANGGHIGLFMGTKPLLENWPRITGWIKEHSGEQIA
jgi:poly(3-hydroxybutyrate) depolymerase